MEKDADGFYNPSVVPSQDVPPAPDVAAKSPPPEDDGKAGTSHIASVISR